MNARRISFVLLPLLALTAACLDGPPRRAAAEPFTEADLPGLLMFQYEAPLTMYYSYPGITNITGGRTNGEAEKLETWGAQSGFYRFFGMTRPVVGVINRAILFPDSAAASRAFRGLQELRFAEAADRIMDPNPPGEEGWGFQYKDRRTWFYEWRTKNVIFSFVAIEPRPDLWNPAFVRMLVDRMNSHSAPVATRSGQ